MSMQQLDHVIGSNSTSAGSGSDSRLCRVYATVRETNGARAVTICGGGLTRQRPAYVTLGHHLTRPRSNRVT